MNTITITGNLGADPELRFTPQGKAVANLSIGDTPRRFNKDTQQWEDAGDTLWLRGSVWGEKAEAACEHLHKGDRVLAEGRLRQRSWDDQDGQKRTVIEAEFDTVAVVPKGQPANRQQAGQAPQPDPWASPQQPPAYDEPPF